MRFSVAYPIGSAGFDPAFLDPATMTRFVQEVERLGIDAVAFTEHPAPSKKWLESGGHESFDPLTALAYCAASTSRLKLMTYLLVVAYRNPLLAAKQIATTDVLSGGRTIVAVGTGYLRSEFAALGVDFDERNLLVDEALEVLTTLWSEDSLSFAGRHFNATAQVSRPTPVQRPHPPLWIGGNSRKARERVAAYGQGWAPMLTDPQLSTSARTAPLESIEQLHEAIADLQQLVAAAGRDPASIDIQVQGHIAGPLDGDPSRAVALFEEVAAAGVTWVCVNPPNRNVDASLGALATFADAVMARVGDQ